MRRIQAHHNHWPSAFKIEELGHGQFHDVSYFMMNEKVIKVMMQLSKTRVRFKYKANNRPNGHSPEALEE